MASSGANRHEHVACRNVNPLRHHPTAEPAHIPALQVKNISIWSGSRKALENVSLTVPSATFTVLLGLNGAGKTTLFSLITRLFDTRAGRIRVFGHAVDREPGEALRRLGVVFQARALDLDITVMDNLLYSCRLARNPHPRSPPTRRREQFRSRARRPRPRSRPQTLRRPVRRIEIGRALLHQPRLLVLDEPTVGLDVASKWAILRHVRSLVRDRHVAVLWATHLLDEIEPADQVVVLHHGKVMAGGSASSVIASTGTTDMRGAFTLITGARDDTSAASRSPPDAAASPPGNMPSASTASSGARHCVSCINAAALSPPSCAH